MCYQDISKTSEDARFDRMYKEWNTDNTKGIQQSSVALGKFNYAVLLKQFGFAIKSGIEQRTLQLKWCRVGATTLLFKDDISRKKYCKYW
jgi:hypothetical protein